MLERDPDFLISSLASGIVEGLSARVVPTARERSTSTMDGLGAGSWSLSRHPAVQGDPASWWVDPLLPSTPLPDISSEWSSLTHSPS